MKDFVQRIRKGDAMNLKQIFVAMFFILCFSLIGGQQATYAEDWRPVPNSSINSMFDASRLIRISPSVIRVWEKSVLPKEIMDKMRRGDKANDYSDYSYTITLCQIDCEKRTKGFVSVHYYNSRGTIIRSFYREDSNIEMVSDRPGSNGKLLTQTVCDYVNKISKTSER